MTCTLVLCDTFDTSISIVSIDVLIPVSKRSRYITIYCGATIPPSIVTWLYQFQYHAIALLLTAMKRSTSY